MPVFYGTHDYQCSPTAHNPDGAHGGRGVTYWSIGSPTSIPIDGALTITFTATHPKCFSAKDACNVYFRAAALPNSNLDHVRVWFRLNGSPEEWSGCCLPTSSGIWNWQAVELANVKHEDPPGTTIEDFNETGLNTLVFRSDENNDVGVTISDLYLYNVYQMCDLFTCNAVPCSSLISMGTDGTIDGLRVDFPCNFDIGGYRSFSHYAEGAHNGQTLEKDQTFAWTFDWSSFSGHNYSEGDVCLFNFNQIHTVEDSQNYQYVTLDVRLNGEHILDYYLTGREPTGGSFYPLFPSVDLMDYTPYYHDNGINTIELTNKGPVSVRMYDDAGINVYRIYKSSQATVPTPPNTPSLNGPTTAGVTIPSRYFSVQATDPQGDSIGYEIDWGDGTNHQTIGPIPSGYTSIVQHTWNSQGTKCVAAKTWDWNHYQQSGSASHTIQVNANPPIPDTPTSLSGPSSGTVGFYSGPFNATSNLGFDLRRFEFNWNGTTEEIAGPNSISTYHVWGSPGTKQVTVRVKDVSEQWSNSATFSPVSVVAESPALYYVSTIVAQGVEPAGGTFETLSNATGASNDANYAHLYGNDYFHGAWMIGSFNAQVTGKIEICASGETPQGAASICVSNNTINFETCELPSIPTSPTWIDCGTVDTPFRYIKIGISDPEHTTHLQIDSIRVTPTQYRTSTVTCSGGGGTTTPSGSSQHPINVYVQFQADADTGYVFSHWLKDGTTTVYDNPYTLQMAANHTLDAVFDPICGTCNTTCQTGCEVSCETGCEVSCETGCEVSCQATCETSCQTTCELTCQTGCEVSCQTGCEIACQATCELECQDCQNCEIACMTECNVSCQTTCETTCQTGCEVGCQTGCEVACQTGCEVACQTGCEVSCQTGCELGCETCQDCQYCEVMCMTPCDLCETN